MEMVKQVTKTSVIYANGEKMFSKQPSLLRAFQELSRQFHRPAFLRLSVYRSVSRTALELVAGDGFGTITDTLILEGRDQDSGYSTVYQAFSHARWSLQDVHRGTLEAALPLVDGDGPIVTALDATVVEKTSRFLFGTRWCHDAAGPKGVGVQLLWGIPLSHLVLTVPTRDNYRATAITIGLDLIPGKPRKHRRRKASASGVEEPPRRKGRPTKEEAAKKAEEPKWLKATEVGLRQIAWLRQTLDTLGQEGRRLVVATDGAYINKTLLRHLPERVTLVGRCRKNAILYHPPTEPGETLGERLPTPEEIAKNPLYPVTSGRFFYGGDERDLCYKALSHPVIWKFDKYSRAELRLLLLMPVPYIGPSGHREYNAYYYVLTNDLQTSEQVLIQAVLDRWQIEVLHRELKHDIRMGKDQCRNPSSMARVPSMVAATYALVKVAALRLFGPGRAPDFYPTLPRWRKYLEASRARRRNCRNKVAPVPRPSVQDFITILRKELRFRWVAGKPRLGRSRKIDRPRR